MKEEVLSAESIKRYTLLLYCQPLYVQDACTPQRKESLMQPTYSLDVSLSWKMHFLRPWMPGLFLASTSSGAYEHISSMHILGSQSRN